MAKVNPAAGLLPLVDVVFLLLIFFMLSFSLATDRVINVTQSQGTSSSEVAMEILLRADGSLLLGQKPLAKQELLATLKARKPKAVYIKAEPAVELDALVEAMEQSALSQTPISGISVVKENP